MTYYLNDLVISKRMFLNTLSITKKVVITSIQKSKGRFTKKSLHSKTGNRKLCDDSVNEVIDYIKSLPIIEPHYERE